MNPEIIGKYAGKINVFLRKPAVQCIMLLLLAYIFLPSYLLTRFFLCEETVVNVGGSCLDQSWHLSIDLAIQKGLVFGRDYVFTYGALGFFSTRSDFGFNPRYLVLFDLFIVVNLTSIAFYAIRKYTNLITVFLCFLVACTLVNGSMYIDQIVFILLMISIFWLSFALKHLKIWGFIIPVFVTCLLFYIKVNISFIGLAVFYFYLICFFIKDRRNYPAKILVGLSVPCLIFLLSFPLNTDLVGYIGGGLSLIGGYNDAMGLKLAGYQKYFVRAVLVAALFFAFFFRKNFKDNAVILLAGLLFTFVLYKQSFVRSDMHISAFFPIFPAICAILLVFYKKVTASQITAMIFICIVCLSAGLRLKIYPNISDRLNYIADVASPPDLNERFAQSFDRFPLPEEARRVIDGKTVDIIPWNIAYVYFNRLNYNPRPVIQSYSAYTPYLMNINKQKYESPTAPDFVIFSNDSIDNRYAFFDDQEVKLTLIKDYECVGFYDLGKENKFLLFERKPNNAIIKYSPPVEKSVKFSEEYNLEDSSKTYFVKFDIKSTVFGKAMGVVYKPQQLMLYVTLEDGTVKGYRVVVPIFNNGVLINPLIREEKDFYDLVQGTPPPSGNKIKSFRIDFDSPDGAKRSVAAAAYDENIKLSVSEVSIIKNN